ARPHEAVGVQIDGGEARMKRAGFPRAMHAVLFAAHPRLVYHGRVRSSVSLALVGCLAALGATCGGSDESTESHGSGVAGGGRAALAQALTHEREAPTSVPEQTASSAPEIRSREPSLREAPDDDSPGETEASSVCPSDMALVDGQYCPIV